MAAGGKDASAADEDDDGMDDAAEVSTAYSCNPYGEPLLQLYANKCSIRRAPRCSPDDGTKEMRRGWAGQGLGHHFSAAALP